MPNNGLQRAAPVVRFHWRREPGPVHGNYAAQRPLRREQGNALGKR
jgi:hypothetical protein